VSATIEIVHFEVPPERRAALLAGHLEARRSIRALSPPGALWSRLAQLGGRRWVEVVGWGSRSTFERALELAPDDPTAGAWFALAEPGFTIVIGEVAQAPGSAPPRDGELELVWSTEPGYPPAAMDGSSWSVVAYTDGRTLVDPSGWTDGEPQVVRLSVHGRVEAGGESPAAGTMREAGPIADAIDAAEEAGAAA